MTTSLIPPASVFCWFTSGRLRSVPAIIAISHTALAAPVGSASSPWHSSRKPQRSAVFCGGLLSTGTTDIRGHRCAGTGKVAGADLCTPHGGCVLAAIRDNRVRGSDPLSTHVACGPPAF
jgi:hypothetical protein